MINWHEREFELKRVINLTCKVVNLRLQHEILLVNFCVSHRSFEDISQFCCRFWLTLLKMGEHALQTSFDRDERAAHCDEQRPADVIPFSALLTVSTEK